MSAGQDFSRGIDWRVQSGGTERTGGGDSGALQIFSLFYLASNDSILLYVSITYNEQSATFRKFYLRH